MVVAFVLLMLMMFLIIMMMVLLLVIVMVVVVMMMCFIVAYVDDLLQEGESTQMDFEYWLSSTVGYKNAEDSC